MLTGQYLLLSQSFADDYVSHVEHFNNPVNAGKIDDFFKQHYESKIAAAKDIYHFDGLDAHIRVNGPMSPDGPDLYDVFYGYGGVSYRDILDAIDLAKDDVDPETGTLYFDTDTPGGTVSMVDEVHQAIATCGLKTVMVNTGMVASGGMWLGSSCDTIVASTPVAFTGSIGVVISTYDITGMLEKMGVKKVVITNHEASEKIPDIATEEGRKVVQEELAAIYSVFKARVVSGRNGKIDAAAIDELKGGVKIASEAVSLGLIDGICDLADENSNGNIFKTRAQAKAEPAMTGDEVMNLEQLKAKHPDLVAAITAEAREGMVTSKELQTQVDAARIEGGDTERTRIQGVEGQLVVGQENLIAELKFDGKTTGPEAAVQVLSAVKADQAKHLKNLRGDGPDPLEPGGDGGDGGGAEGGTPEEKAKAEWDKDANLRAEFADNFEAFKAFKEGESAGRARRLGK